MGYCNPFLRAAGDDPASLAASMHASGVSGVILVDLPPDAGLPGQVHHSLFAALTAQGVPPVPLAAPTTAPHRLRALMAAAKDGFLYCVSVAGVTGTRDALPEGLAEWVAGLRAAAGGEDEARYGAML
jgi:tryptophan synthase alpha subunit